MLTEHIFEAALAKSRPHNIEIDDTMRAGLDQMVQMVAATSTPTQKPSPSKWRRPIFLVPAVGVLAIATTAGAVAYSFSITDATVIPINYTTSNGQAISCGYGVSGVTQIAGVSTAALRSYVRSHDWTGTGQRAYQYAIAHPYVPTAAEQGQFTQAQIDSFSFSQALAVVIGDAIPPSVEPEGYVGGGESTCAGTLR